MSLPVTSMSVTAKCEDCGTGEEIEAEFICAGAYDVAMGINYSEDLPAHGWSWDPATEEARCPDCSEKEEAA